MKKSLLLLTLIVVFTQAQAQKIKEKHVPTNVVSAFHKSYPMVKTVHWHRIGERFEASYDRDKMEKNLIYDVNANLVEYKMEIMASGMPTAASDYMKKNHKEHKVRETYKVTDASGNVSYEAEVKGMDLYFDANGNFIKSLKDKD